VAILSNDACNATHPYEFDTVSNCQVCVKRAILCDISLSLHYVLAEIRRRDRVINPNSQFAAMLFQIIKCFPDVLP
jgi:hypothetical protein